jgi:opacity protein-like surface antigen
VAVSAPAPQVLVSSSNRSTGEIRIAPHAGYRWFENNNSQLKAENRFLTGFSLEGAVNSHFAFEGSFTYGRDEFNYRYLSAGSYVNNNYLLPYNYGSYPNIFYGPQALAYPVTRSRDSYEASAGVKVGVTVDRVRPFLSAGIGGIIQKYNIDDRYTTAQARAAGWSRTTTQVIANLGGGLNIALADNLLVGGRFDYQPIVNRKSGDVMNIIYGDAKNRYRALGELSLRF